MDPALIAVREFVAGVAPFSVLPGAALDQLVGSLSIQYLRRGDSFPPADDPPGLHIVRKGALEFRDADEQLVERLAEGDYSDRPCVDGATATEVSGRAIEDSLLYRLDCAILQALRREHPEFDAHFAQGRSDRLRRARHGLLSPHSSRGDLLQAPVSSLIRAAPLSCDEDTTVQDAARRMRDAGASSLLVMRDGVLCGILTDRDLRNRALAEGLAPDTRVARVMTAQVLSIPLHTAAFDALLLMTRRGVHHLPVMEGARPVGMITDSDLMQWLSSQPSGVAGMVRKADSVGELANALAHLPELHVQLVAAGADGVHLGQSLTAIIDAATVRLVELAQDALGPPPLSYAWVATGSQARGEQTCGSDQDNALILADGFDEAAHGAYFTAFATRVNDGLDACGIRYCPGKVMAGNPDWRLSLAGWLNRFAGWLAGAERRHAMLAANFLDMRVIAGDHALCDGLRAAILPLARGREGFVTQLIHNARDNRPPLGIFRRFVLSAGGEHAGMLDLKTALLIPVVDIARIVAVANGSVEVATLDRLRAAAGSGWLSDEAAADLGEAFAFAATLRARHQAEQIRRGKTADNWLDPQGLSSLERGHLKAAFALIGDVQQVLQQHHATGA